MKNDRRQLTHAHVCGDDGDEQLTVMIREGLAPVAKSTPRVTFHASDAYGEPVRRPSPSTWSTSPPVVELLAAELAKLKGRRNEPD